MNAFGVFVALYGVMVLGVCGWVVLRSTPAQFAPPDPTAGEARALLLGLGCFWAIWGPAVLEMDRHPALGAALAMPLFAAGGWLFIGGFARIAARISGMSLREWLSSGRTRRWKERDRRFGYLLNISYFRRASSVLGWSPVIVFTLLGLLLAGDLTILAARSFGH